MPRTIIFANGTLPDIDSARRLLRPDDFILAADGGTRHALELGRAPNLVLGDMDSLNQADWKKLEQLNVPIEIFPRDKNETDLELAIERAIEIGNKEIIILAALGGRLDQTIANIALLTDARLSTFDLRLDDGVEQAFFARTRSQVAGRSGDIVSLIPWGGDVHITSASGLKWPLSDEILYAHKPRGISNEMTADIANIEIKSGLLLIIHRRQVLSL